MTPGVVERLPDLQDTGGEKMNEPDRRTEEAPKVLLKDEEGDLTIRVGQRLKLLRLTADLSQERLGNLIGLSCQQVQKYETGVNRLSVPRLIQICRVMDISIEGFFDDVNLGGGEGTLNLSRRACRVARDFDSIEGEELREAVSRLIRVLTGAADENVDGD